MNEAEMIKQVYEHMTVLNREMGAVQAELQMIKWFLGIVIATSTGALLTSVYNLVLHKNKK
jgi:hypothetical protein